MPLEQLLPSGFLIPDPPNHPLFRFEPLGPEHNAADLEAWSTSIDQFTQPRGSARTDGPSGPTLAENLHDLQTHHAHHLALVDFAWTVLDPTRRDVVTGCVYLKPDPAKQADAEARSWMRADRAYLDLVLREHLRPWFADQWPITVRYA